MRFKTFIIMWMLVVGCYYAHSQQRGDMVQSRILILLDESSSMVQKWSGNKEKYLVARDIILRIMDSVYYFNPDVEFSLRVFGHQYTVQENNCYDTKNEVEFSKSNRTQMELRLKDIHPLGVTPIAYALKEAADNDLIDEIHNAYSIILITDGGESCGGDLCAVMSNLVRNKVFFIPYIVGLEDAPELRSSYECMGNFLKVTKDGEIGTAVSTIVSGYRPILKITKSDYKELKFTGHIPSLLKVTTPDVSLPTPPKPKDTIVQKITAPIILPPVPAINHLFAALPLVIELKSIAPTALNNYAVPAPIVLNDFYAAPIVEKINNLPATSVRDYEITLKLNFHLSAAAVPKVMDTFTPLLHLVQEISKINTTSLNILKEEDIKPVIIPTYQPPLILDTAFLQPMLPKVPVVLHLLTANIKMFETPAIAAKTVTLISPPKANDTNFLIPPLPSVPHINHLSSSPILALKEILPTQIAIQIYVPPSVADTQLLLPPLPTVPVINHIAIASTIKITAINNVPVPLSQVAVPHILDSISYIPPLTAVNTVSHLITAILKPISIGNILQVPIPTYATPSVADSASLLPPKPEISRISHLSTSKYAAIPEDKIIPKILHKFTPPPVLDSFSDQPLKLTTPKIIHMKPAILTMLDDATASTMPIKLSNNIIPKVSIIETPQIPKVDKFVRLKPAKEMEPRVMFLIEDHAIRQREVPAPPSFKPIPSKALAYTLPSTSPKLGVPPGISSTYTVETEDAKETSVMVYFTNGHGKFYETTPQVMFIDPATNSIMKKFYRTVDISGSPEQQKDIQPGVYNIAVSEKRNLMLYDVNIMQNKVNKIFVKLKNCSLVFAYENAPNRPVTEFSAVVIQRNVPNGRVIRQKCAQKLEYEPGNYHVLIETYPEDKRNLDLDFDDIKEIQIPQPGMVKFTSRINNGKFDLYKTVGDKFLQFDTKSFADTTIKHLRIQPGIYQAHYIKDPKIPRFSETVVTFTVKSNQETEIILPDE